MSKKLLFVAVIILLTSATLFGFGFYSQPQIMEKQTQIGKESGLPIVKFTLPTNYSGVVTLNATGAYSINNATMLKIINQTGTIEYFEQVISLPIQVHLFNSSGEYVATFQQMDTTNSTILTATTQISVVQTIYPYNLLLVYSAPIFWIGLLLFPLSIHYEVNSELKEERELKNRFIKGANAKSGMFVFYLLLFSFLSSIYLAIALGQPIIIVGLPLFITVAMLFFYLRTASHYSKVDIKTNYVQIVSLQKISEKINYAYFGLFPFLIATFFLHFLARARNLI